VASGVVFALVIALFFSLYQKIYSPTINAEEMEKQRLLEYASRFKLSPPRAGDFQSYRARDVKY
jgi:hypothetical protein